MRTTDKKCHNCEEAYLRGDNELYCPNCHFVPDRDYFHEKYEDPWELFHENRSDADGRPVMVGGFAEPYLESDGLY